MECTWAKKEPNKSYHNNTWGKPEIDDTKLFEYLVLEGAQAGLSWEMVLKRKDEYKKAFLEYDIDKLINLSDEQLDYIRENTGIIKNKRKVASVRQNAQAFKNIQSEYESFAKFIWKYVDNKPIINMPKTFEDVPSQSDLSLQISKDLKKLGFNFVGPTIIYSYMQAIGMIDDHLVGCSCKTKKTTNIDFL